MAWLSGMFYDVFMGGIENSCLVAWRKKLLSDLEGEVLEVGAGTGANLALYPDTVRSLTIVEPDPGMRGQLEKRIAGTGRSVRVERAFLESLPYEDNSFDVVVGTLVLCTVRDTAQALSEVRRVLRPTGRFVFIEHVAAHETTKAAKIQEVLNPAWKYFAGGCNMTRHTEDDIRRAGFEIVDLEHDHLCALAKPLWPTIRGVARVG